MNNQRTSKAPMLLYFLDFLVMKLGRDRKNRSRHPLSISGPLATLRVCPFASPPLSAALVRRGTADKPALRPNHLAGCWLYYVLAALAGGTYSAERPSRQHD